MPEGAIFVGRPSKWGNPWRVGEAIGADINNPPMYRAGAIVDHALAAERLLINRLAGTWSVDGREERRGAAGARALLGFADDLLAGDYVDPRYGPRPGDGGPPARFEVRTDG